MPEIQWNIGLVEEFIFNHGRDFARIKTPRGIRTNMKKIFNTNKLEGKCFFNALVTAHKYPDLFWYCEGLVWARTYGYDKARFVPHAWLALKNFEEDWALDFTWSWDNFDNRPYFGIKFDPLFAIKHHRLLRVPYVSTNKVPIGGLSLLSHRSIIHGIVPGFKELYAI